MSVILFIIKNTVYGRMGIKWEIFGKLEDLGFDDDMGTIISSMILQNDVYKKPH